MEIIKAKRILGLRESCEDLQEITKEFRKLALRHHPDKGGDVEKFIEIKEAYDFLLDNFNLIKNFKTNELIKDEKLNDKIKQTFSVIIDTDVKFEIIGFWIWATGKTYVCKDNLKTLGFKFSKKKLAWYWVHPEFQGKRTKKGFDLNRLRTMHNNIQLEQIEIRKIT